MGKIDLSDYNIRTDLIIENDTLVHNEKMDGDITITKTYDHGNYITITFDDVTDSDSQEVLIKHLVSELKTLLELNKIKQDDSCLIIGLGNELSTPDSLGVKVLSDIIVTGHLYKLGKVSDNYKLTYAFSPNVMANTGIESADIITSLINKINPDFVIAIDALASRKIERINKTIQITDTGIHPGSGIGNNRGEISYNTLKIPVIAIGVPTVVMSSVIVYDTLDYLIRHISYIKENESINKLSFIKRNYLNKLKEKDLNNQDKNNLLGLFGSLTDNERYQLISEVLDNTKLNLIVTPTEIDFLIAKLSNVIAKAINKCLHNI